VFPAPLFRERSRPVQALLGGVVPALFGAVTGLALGASAALYWVLSLVALIGGVLAGFEHRDGWGGADRGLVGGTLFGSFLLIAHAISGSDAEVKLPGFEPILIVFTAIIGALAGALGGRLRRAVMARQAVAESPPGPEPPQA
jgi:hypothetical protein